MNGPKKRGGRVCVNGPKKRGGRVSVNGSKHSKENALVCEIWDDHLLFITYRGSIATR